MSVHKQLLATALLVCPAVLSAQTPDPAADQARAERWAQGTTALRHILERLGRNPSSLNIQCSYPADECTQLRSLIVADRLGNILPCNLTRPGISCVQLTFRHTGNIWQGSYLAAQVWTTSDFDSPEDFTVTLDYRSYVMH